VPLEQTLDGATLARVWLGEVTQWNDSAIAALNPLVTLPSDNITMSYTCVLVSLFLLADASFGRSSVLPHSSTCADDTLLLLLRAEPAAAMA
jgi:ABC-type phosphate transport system substrate-binding protein